MKVAEGSERAADHLVDEEARAIEGGNFYRHPPTDAEMTSFPGHLIAVAKQTVVTPPTARSEVPAVDSMWTSTSRFRSKQICA